MQRYPKYDSTDLEWCKEIPSHWELVPNIALFWNRSEKNNDGLPPYSVSIKNGVTKQTYSDDEIIRSSEDKTNYKRICAGDIVYNKMRMWQGAVGLSPAEGIVSPAYIVCAPRKKFQKRYFEYLFRTPDYIGYSDKYSYGLCDDMNSLRFEHFKRMHSLYPPVDEQKAIVDYLDDKTAKIDKLIDTKQRQIELLKEQRHAVINQVVTKGLDPDVEMKDSGIEWLGEIPKHWEAKKLKYIITIKSGDGLSNENIHSEGEYEVYGGNGHLGYTNDFNVDGNTLVVGRVGAKCGNVHLIENKYWVSDNALVVKTTQNYEFIYFLLTSMNLNNLANQNAQPLITATMVKFQYMALPNEKEQTEIVRYIEKELSRIQEAETKAKNQIELLQEYRTALISEAVTGKIDVREAV